MLLLSRERCIYMATEEQIAANRRNAQLSTGPRTEAGKKASRMNAYRHGLTGQIDVTTPDEQEAKDKFIAGIVASLTPEPGIELQFAHSIAEDHWRLNRARSIENNIFMLSSSFQDCTGETEDPEIDKALGAARAFIADPKRFQLLTIYERRIHCSMQKNLQMLNEMQATRRALEAKQIEQAKAQRAQAFEEACLLAQLAEMEGVSYDPATDYPDPNGFVCKTEEITQFIRREQRLRLAKSAKSSNWNRPIRRAA